jgi:hypothetical protein
MNVGFHGGSPEHAAAQNGRVGYSEGATSASPCILSTEAVDKSVEEI